MQYITNPKTIYPNIKIKKMCFIKYVVAHLNIIIRE